MAKEIDAKPPEGRPRDFQGPARQPPGDHARNPVPYFCRNEQKGSDRKHGEMMKT